jgi:hypothetical protein
MLPFCGKTFPIKSRVERFVDENTGKLIQLKSDAYILDGVVCSGNRSSGKWFCRRAIYLVAGGVARACHGDTATNRAEAADSTPRA